MPSQVKRRYALGSACYTFPLIVKTLEACGPPTEISKVMNSNQKGPLLVTLACELASMTAQEICHNLMGLEEHQWKFEFVSIETGNRPAAITRELERLRTEIQQTHENIEGLEGRDHFINLIIPSQGGRSGKAKIKEQRFSADELRSERSLLRRERAALLQQLTEKNQKVTALSQQLIVLEPDVFIQGENTKKWQGFLAKRVNQDKWSKLVVDLIPLTSKNPGTALDLLFKRDISWLQQFAHRLKNEFQTVSKKGGTLRFMLRDPRFDEALLNYARNQKYSEVGATISLLSDPDTNVKGTTISYPGEMEFAEYKGLRGELNENSIHRWWQVLRDQDTSMRKWIKEHAGMWHSCSPYDFSLPAQMYCKKFEQTRKEYPAGRAASELYFCLSLGHLNDFKPTLAFKFDQSKWEEWVEKARLEEPPYWQKSSLIA